MGKIALTLAFVLVLCDSATSHTLKSPAIYVTAGLGLEGIAVGYSNMNSVVAKFGDEFSLIEHKVYSFEIRYSDKGLSFYYRHSDPKKKIFCIAIRPPCRAFTARGIVLGESTLQDVFNAYGESRFSTTTAMETWFFEYPGVAFHVKFNAKKGFNEGRKELLKKEIVEIEIGPIEAEWPPSEMEQTSYHERRGQDLFTHDVFINKRQT